MRLFILISLLIAAMFTVTDAHWGEFVFSIFICIKILFYFIYKGWGGGWGRGWGNGWGGGKLIICIIFI